MRAFRCILHQYFFIFHSFSSVLSLVAVHHFQHNICTVVLFQDNLHTLPACTRLQCPHSCDVFSFLTNCTPGLCHLGRDLSLLCRYRPGCDVNSVCVRQRVSGWPDGSARNLAEPDGPGTLTTTPPLHTAALKPERRTTQLVKVR